VSPKWSLSIRYPAPQFCIHRPTKHVPLEFLLKHTSVWIVLWALKVMGFCSFSCWECLCSTPPLKEIPGRHYCMSCPSYTTSNLLQFTFFELVFSSEILMTHLFVNSCSILPDKSHLSYLKPLFQINFLTLHSLTPTISMNVVGCGYLWDTF
jgi:hypothetical protein